MISGKSVPFETCDSLCITSLVDNSADRSFPDNREQEIVSRFQFPKEIYDGILPVAEHGFSMMIEAESENNKVCTLVDAGVTPSGFSQNLIAFNVDPHTIDSVVISHGHADHFLGLPVLHEEYGIQNLPVIVHPGALQQRRFSESLDGPSISLKNLSVSELTKWDFNVRVNDSPSSLGELLLVSGTVPRNRLYENKLPFHYSKGHDGWSEDPDVMDDQFVVASVRGKGLVIVTGCGHSGLINIIRYAQDLTGEQKLLAVMGGFHLYQNSDNTQVYTALKEINPRYIIPTHCTGWKDIHEMARLFPDQFIQNSVGTKYSFSV